MHEIHAIAGGVTIPDANLQLISRNVLGLVIPANARAIQTALSVNGSDGKPMMRKLLDVHVASPNGISNHLLVEVQPKPSTDQAAATVTRSIQVSYSLLQKSDASGVTFVPVETGVSGAEIDLAWDPKAGSPPAATSASFTFPNVLAPGGGDLVIPANGLTRKGNTNTFALTGGPLNDFAAKLVEALRTLNVLTPNTPATQLSSSSITLANPNPPGKDVIATASGPVIISLVPTLPVPQLSPAVLQVNLDKNTGKASPVTPPGPDLTLDWLGNVASVRADVTIELTMDNKPLGSTTSLTFSDSAGEITIVKKTGKRTIANTLFMNKLNALLALPTTVNKPAPGQGKVLNARTISLTPQLDGFTNLVPVLVESPFEIDTDPFTAKTSAVTRQGTMPVAGRGSATIGSPLPRAAAHDPTVAAKWSTLGRGVVMPPLSDSSIQRAATGKNRPVSGSLTPSLPSGRAPEACSSAGGGLRSGEFPDIGYPGPTKAAPEAFQDS